MVLHSHRLIIHHRLIILIADQGNKLPLTAKKLFLHLFLINFSIRFVCVCNHGVHLQVQDLQRRMGEQEVVHNHHGLVAGLQPHFLAEDLQQ